MRSLVSKAESRASARTKGAVDFVGIAVRRDFLGCRDYQAFAYAAKCALCLRAKYRGVRSDHDLSLFSALQEVDMKLLTVARAALCATMVFWLAIGIAAQNHVMGTVKPATMMTGLGDLHHPVSTRNMGAQGFF